MGHGTHLQPLVSQERSARYCRIGFRSLACSDPLQLIRRRSRAVSISRLGSFSPCSALHARAAPVVKMAFGARATSSAYLRRVSALPPPSRMPIRMLRPSVQPNCRSPWRNAAQRSEMNPRPRRSAGFSGTRSFEARQEMLRHLTQLGALDLGAVGARRRGESVENDAARRHLKPSKPGGTELPQRCLVEGGPRAQRDESDRCEPARAKRAHGLAALDPREALDMRLNLGGRDEITTEPQHVSHSRLKDEATVAYEVAEIADAQPTVVRQRPAGRLIVTKIARHQARPADLDLAAHPGRQETAALWVAHAHSVALTDWKAAGSCALLDGRLWALPGKERLHLAHAVEPA